MTSWVSLDEETIAKAAAARLDALEARRLAKELKNEQDPGSASLDPGSLEQDSLPEG